jgi:hypothetical protein
VTAVKIPRINSLDPVTPTRMQGNTVAKTVAGHPKKTLNTVRFAERFFESDLLCYAPSIKESIA